MLLRHPSPPAGFTPAGSGSDAWVFPGRHPAVTANNNVELGGVQTATALLTDSGATLRERAALVAHEAFHVYQQQKHPTWVANEVELFAYPVDDIPLLALRRLETVALGRAVTARDRGESACWTRTALDTRRERFAALPPGPVEYERRTELKEGLARYVQLRAAGAAQPPLGIRSPEDVRERAYESGAALALLLDRFSSSWKGNLAQSDSVALDMLLGDASLLPARVLPCEFTVAERARVDSAAAEDLRQMRTRKSRLREDFMTRAGWRLIITAGTSPMFPQEFDPLNVQVVAAGEVLHTRYIRLGNNAGSVEVFGRSSITEAAGAHPLFNGVRSLTVAGLAAEPLVTESDSTVRIRAEGLTADLRAATVQRAGDTVTVRLGAGR